MKRKTRKQQRLEAKFMEAVEARLREIGAADNEGEWKFMYPLCLETEVGDLVIHVHETWVAMRFADVERARQRLPHGFYDRLNRYSGKYNVHFSDDGVADLECVFRTIDGALADVLPVRTAV